MVMSRVIGIDLGTTNSCVAVLEGRRLSMQSGQFFPLNVIWDRITEKRLTEKHIRRRKYLLLF